MKCSALLAFVFVAADLPPGASGPPVSSTIQVRLNGHTFTLPAGFEIEQVAGPPLVDRPIVADFDEQGRLYVADSSGSNDKVQQQFEQKPHRILRLEDSRGQGSFDRRTLFAERMMFPEGALWLAGSLYVAAPPSIWKLTDTKGAGVADLRTEWFQGKTLTRCANDLHGPYLGPDGWIYWCKGAFAKQSYERPGQRPFVTRAAHIFRSRPDGTGIEPVMTGGMDNPVKVVFTPGGERIFTTTFLQHPGGGRRDGLIHAVYGGVYGKDHDVLNDHPRTGPGLLSPLVHLGPAAPAGITRYESDSFGPGYRDNLFVAQFNMHKISRHVLEPCGATFRTRDEDFLLSDNLDFHPTDVLADADGSLLVIDTGGWYKICCPSSQLHKPDILGAIYRIRRQGAPVIADPRGLSVAWLILKPQDLVRLLDDPRPAVRRRAVQALADQGTKALGVLTKAARTAPSSLARCNAVWTATRIAGPGARALVHQALSDTDETVRQAALHSVSVWRDHDALPELLRLVADPSSSQNQRAAAEALGRIGNTSAVPALLAALKGPVDGVLQHSLTYALLEIGDAVTTTVGLTSPNANVRRAALLALDQIEHGGLRATSVLPELTANDPALQEAAWWIASRHLEWGEELAHLFAEQLDARDGNAKHLEQWAERWASFANVPAVQRLLGERLRDAKTGALPRSIILQVLARSHVKAVPEIWIAGLTQVLERGDRESVRAAVSIARSWPRLSNAPEGFVAALRRIANDSSAETTIRLTALAALPGKTMPLSDPLFALLCECLGRERPVQVRALAVEVLLRTQPTAEQLIALAQAIRTTGPTELDRVLDVFAQSTDERVGHSLVGGLRASAARSSLRVENLKARLTRFGTPVQREVEDLCAVLKADTARQQARLDQLLAGLHEGDIRRGQAVFSSAKASCSACHAVGYLGGNIGPDLTRVGSIRSDRDLLEAIVFPSASLVRSYEPVLVSTKDGKFHNGLVRKDTAEEIVLAIGAHQEIRIARQDIEDMQPSNVSIMPAGLDQQLTNRELADIVAFLKACK